MPLLPREETQGVCLTLGYDSPKRGVSLASQCPRPLALGV